jgi:hypothetical protein
VRALSIATIMVWLGIFVEYSSFEAATMTLSVRLDCILMLACVMVAPVLGLLGVQKQNHIYVRFNAGFNCIGGCIAFVMIGVVSASLIFAEQYFNECVNSKKQEPFCAEISESTKEDLESIHKKRTYVSKLVIPMCLALGVLACVSALFGRCLASQMQSQVAVRRPLNTELLQTTIQSHRQTQAHRVMV